MKVCNLLVTILAHVVVGVAALPHESATTNDACAQLLKIFPATTFEDFSAEYLEKSEVNWSKTCVLKPTCVFEPESAQDVSKAINIVRNTKTKFAVRSGGHMAVPGASNINAPGVLISTVRLNQVVVSKDKSTVEVGTGLRWSEVYKQLDSHGIAVAGGRFAPVGVGGLLLGGGVNYFGPRVGWSQNTVVKYQVVLSSGQIIQASQTSHSDLWWALKGGQANFGIVTSFTLKSIPIGKVWAGTIQSPGTVLDQYLDAVANFALPTGGSADIYAHANPIFLYSPSTNQMVAGVNLFHTGEDKPESLVNFTALPALSDTTKTWDSFNAYVEGDASGPAYGDRSSRRLFWSFSVKATPEAVRLVNTTFIARAAAEFGTVPNVLTSLTYQTVTKDWVAAARKAGGDALDLDPNDGNFFLMLVSTTWGDESLDEKISAFSASVTDEIVSKAKQQGLDYPFAYINDAGQGQRIFDLYGKGKSLPRLKAISRHYDPCQLFQKYQGGGFKLN